MTVKKKADKKVDVTDLPVDIDETLDDVDGTPKSKPRVRKGRSVSYKKAKVKAERKKIIENDFPITMTGLIQMMYDTGMTPHELSRLTGLSPTVFEQIEAGDSPRDEARVNRKLNKIATKIGLGDKG